MHERPAAENVSVPWPLLARLPDFLVVASMPAYVFFFSFASILIHDRFRIGGMDLGSFDQAVWNSFQGRPLRLTNLAGVRLPTNRADRYLHLALRDTNTGIPTDP